MPWVLKCNRSVNENAKLEEGAGGGIGDCRAIMFLKKKPAAGIILGGISLVAVASEYPEQFARMRRKLPEYLDQGMELVEFASRAGDRIAEYFAERAREGWEAIRD